MRTTNRPAALAAEGKKHSAPPAKVCDQAGFQTRLERGSQNSGIPKKELRQICLHAGLSLLERGDLTIASKSPSKVNCLLPNLRISGHVQERLEKLAKDKGISETRLASCLLEGMLELPV